MYIHELKNWPNFFWDKESITNLLIQLRHQQGRLIGGMESIGFHLREESVLQTLTQDVVKSSEIVCGSSRFTPLMMEMAALAVLSQT